MVGLAGVVEPEISRVIRQLFGHGLPIRGIRKTSEPPNRAAVQASMVSFRDVRPDVSTKKNAFIILAFKGIFL